MAGDRRSTRLGVLGLVSLLLLGALGTRLWFLQVVDSAGAQERVTANRTRTVMLLPERGRIIDSDGRVLADNRRVLQVAVDWSVIRKAPARAALFARLSGALNTPAEDLEARYNANFYSPLLPLPLAEDVNEATAQFLTERIEDYPGVTIQETWKRQYPYAPLAAHVVGFMGAITAEELDEYAALDYQQSERVGQFGAEKSFESVLRGTPGYAVYEVRASGVIVSELERVEPITGNDVRLSIDLDVQQLAEQALQTQLAARRMVSVDQIMDKGVPAKPNQPLSAYFKASAGSVIVENYQNGAILAMASYPTFDNRWFESGVSGDKLGRVFPTNQLDADGNEILGPDGEPIPIDPGNATLVNRAIQGQYNIGSTFKPFVSWAALNAPGGVLPDGANWYYHDDGAYKLESIEDDVCASGVKCEFRNSVDAQGVPSRYGPVKLEDALAVSSDAYFYRIGELIFTRNNNEPVLQELVRKFGFGSKSGIDLPYEYAGRVPDKESKKVLHDKGVLAESESENYLVGDNVQLSIGQGLLAVTPIQLATAYSTFANAGTVLKPQIAMQILAPGTPDSATTPGLVDLSRAEIVRSFEAAESEREHVVMPEDTQRGPILRGLTRVITGPGVEYPKGRLRSPTGASVFGNDRYDYADLPIAGKTGTAQGAASLPWNDSSAFTGISLDPSRPWTVTAYLERSGYGAQAAAPVAKCMFLGLQGKIPLDPVQLSDFLDINDTVAAHDSYLADTSCLATASTERGSARLTMSIPLLSRRPDSGLGNIRSAPSRPSRNIDWTLLFAVAALATAGAFAIYSVTWFRDADPYWYTLRQVVWLILAALVLTAVMSLDYHWLKERAMFLYGCTLLVLVLTLFTGATLADGSRLGFDLGPFRVQPAEFAKISVLLALAGYLSDERNDELSYSRFLGGLMLVGAPMVLIALQPDLGSASVLLVCAMGMLLVAGAKVRYIALVTSLAVASVLAAIVSGAVQNYQLRRFEAFLRQNSEETRLESYVQQLRYAKRAISTGGVWGKGWLEGPLTNGRYIPVQQSDFIFSGIAEQFGLVGTGVLVGLYGLLLLRIWRVAHLSKDMLGTYICAGVFAMIAWQTFENIGMNMGIMPITGVPLPFVSYGGSSILSLAAMIGLVQSVHMRRMR